MKEEKVKETEKIRGEKNRGGRPKKVVKRSYVIKVKCTILEKKLIERKAKEGGFALSVYMRMVGLNGTIVMRKTVLTREFLEYKATLYHTASNLNQIARKINATGDITEGEKEVLLTLQTEIKEHLERVQKSLVI